MSRECAELKAGSPTGVLWFAAVGPHSSASWTGDNCRKGRVAQRSSRREANIQGAGGRPPEPLSLERWASIAGADPRALGWCPQGNFILESGRE